MSRIEHAELQKAPTASDQWLTEKIPWGGVLVARITPAGKRLFYFRYAGPEGKRETLPLGAYDRDGRNGLTLADARREATNYSRLRHDGVTDLRSYLAQQEQAKQAETQISNMRAQAELEALCQQQLADELERQRRITTRALFERWKSTALAPMVDHRTGRKKMGPRTGRRDGGNGVAERFELHVLPALGDRPAEDVRRADVIAVLDKLAAQGKVRTWNLVLTELRQMFNFAIDRDLIQSDPTSRIPKLEEQPRDRWLRYEEVSTLANKLPAAGLTFKSQTAIWLMLGTLARIGELMKAKWEDLDFNREEWRIPETKNGKPHIVHLSAFTKRHFQALLEAAPRDRLTGAVTSPWVFPAKMKPNDPVCPASLNKQLLDRQKGTEAKPHSNRSPHTSALLLPHGPWTPHDLRRTGATYMSKLGIRIEVIHMCQNHTLQDDLARRYIHDDRIDERRHAFEALGQLLQSLVDQQQQPTNVIPINQTAA